MGNWNRLKASTQVSRACLALLMALSVACRGGGCGSTASSSSSPPAAAARPDASATPAEQLSFVQNQPARLRAFLDNFPRELTDVDALGATLKTPADALGFVRDRIAFEPYSGIMKGAVGTLATRGGNAIDRALLLAALLKRQGISSTIAGGQLTDAEATAVLARAARQPGAVAQIASALPRALIDLSPSADDDRALMGSARARVQSQRAGADASLAALRASLDQAGLVAPPHADPMATVRGHYWVRAFLPQGAVDLDPTLATSAEGQHLADSTQTFDPANPPPALHHRLTLRVVLDVLEDGAVSTQEVLRAEARAVDLNGRNIRLVIAPKQLARDQNDFLAQVTMGQAKPVTEAFQLKRTTSTGGGVADMFGGLAGAVGGDALLGRLALEVTSSAPDLPDASYRRVIVDRLEREGGTDRIRPDMTDDNSVRPLLVQVWDGAIDIGAVHPAHVVAARLQAVEAQQPMMAQAVEATMNPSRSFKADALAQPALSAELVGYFFFSGLTHHGVGVEHAPAIREYHTRPRLAFMRSGVAVHDWATPGTSRRFQRGLDVLNAPYGFVGAGAETANLALRVGVADAMLERAFVTDGMEFNTIPLASAASKQRIASVAITQRHIDKMDALQLPAAIREALRHELGRGRTLVLPTALVALNDVRTFGWWSLDPESGVPLGQMELGAGQGAVETSQLTRKIMEMNQVIMNFYGGLLGCYFVEAADQIGDPQGPYQVANLPFASKISGGSGRSLAQCVAANVCELIVSYTMLAATSASMAPRAWAAIAEIGEMLIQMYIAEKATTLACKDL